MFYGFGNNIAFGANANKTVHTKLIGILILYFATHEDNGYLALDSREDRAGYIYLGNDKNRQKFYQFLQTFDKVGDINVELSE